MTKSTSPELSDTNIINFFAHWGSCLCKQQYSCSTDLRSTSLKQSMRQQLCCNVQWGTVLHFIASVNSTCAQFPPPPWATAGHLPAMSVPGVGHLQMVHCPGAGHLSTPGPIPSFWHARGFLSEYNYKEGFTGRKADWLICQGQE